MSNRLLISKTRVKSFLKKQDVRVSGDFYEALNEEISGMLLKVAKRATGNKRSTALVVDL